MGDGTVQPDFFPRVIDSTSLHFAYVCTRTSGFPGFFNYLVWQIYRLLTSGPGELN